MKKVFLLCLVILSLKTNFLFAGFIDHLSSARNMPGSRYIRLYYENDYFTATDRYYTQGISLEYWNPQLRKNPLLVLCPKPPGFHIRYGLSIDHNGFTPSSIRHAEILFNDHPFSACLFFKSMVSATGESDKIIIASAFYTGIIGPLANGSWMQKSIHKWTNNIPPLGWEHQIKNDIILNYQIKVDKQVIGLKNFFQLDITGDLKAGTFDNRAGIGFVMKAGRFENPFSLIENKNQSKARKRFQLFLYAEPVIELVGYQATLQGGFFNKNSPYTLFSSQIERLSVKAQGGLVLNYGKVYMEYFQSFHSKEFHGAELHRWGGVRVGLSF